MRNTTSRVIAGDCIVSNDTWTTGLNNNDVIIGPSGSGKTRGYVMPNLLQGGDSLIVADTKGSLRRSFGAYLARNGYTVIDLDLTDCGHSVGYNPLDYIRCDPQAGRYNDQDIMTIASAMVPVENHSDPFWDMAARTYLESMIGYVLECLPEEEHHLDSVVQLFSTMGSPVFDLLFTELADMCPDSFAAVRYNMYKSTARAEKMYASIQGILAEKLSLLYSDGLKTMFTRQERIDLACLGREKTAMFLTVSDTDRSMDRLANLFYTQALHVLCRTADASPGNRLEVPVRFILDDFAANVFIPDFDKITSVIRSREISVSIILQSLTQLESMYGHAKAATILNNCDTCLYLGGQDVETAQYISIKANRSVNTILNMPLDRAWLFTRGREPRMVHKYCLETHERYRELFAPETEEWEGEEEFE